MSERRRLLNQFERAGRDMAELPDWVRMPKTAKPDPSVPLSAIRALVQQWEERVAVCRRISVESAARGELVLGRAWAEEADHKQESITELTALCPAPPEDRK